MDQNVTTIEHEHDLISRRDTGAVDVRSGGRWRGLRSALLAAGGVRCAGWR